MAGSIRRADQPPGLDLDLDALRDAACLANRELARLGLVFLAFGNASVIDRATDRVAIKPSGASCADLEPGAVVVLSLRTGEPSGSMARPSSDTPTHLELYRRFPGIGAIVHTHSPYATAWAQARQEIPALGTTHADHFRGPVPVTRDLTSVELETEYEANTGRVIVDRFVSQGLDPLEVPAVLVAAHGPFAWGASSDAAVANAAALETVATIATYQAALGPLEMVESGLLDRHFNRKHGPAAYYGQPTGVETDR